GRPNTPSILSAHVRGSEPKPGSSRQVFLRGTQKKRPRYRGHHKEAREGGKVREGDARSHSKNWNDQKGEVERIGRGLKSFSVVRPLLLLYSKALARPK